MDELAPWTNFLTAEVGATATLTGLIIVAVSINLQRILEFPQLPGRAGEILIMLAGVLIGCGLGLIPGQSLRTFGIEVAGVGLLMTVPPVVIQGRQIAIMKTQPVTWWLWRHLTGLCAGVPVLIGGVLLVSGVTSGLYWFAAGVLATLAATVWNAWVLLVEILR
jgi:modulator of FtsH protease